MFTDAVRRHLNAIAAHDIAEFEATTAPDVRLVGTDGNLIEGPSAVEAHRQWFEDPSWRFESEIVSANETIDAGWALARIRYDTGSAVSRFWLFLLFRRDGSGAWRLAYDQATPIAG